LVFSFFMFSRHLDIVKKKGLTNCREMYIFSQQPLVVYIKMIRCDPSSSVFSTTSVNTFLLEGELSGHPLGICLAFFAFPEEEWISLRTTNMKSTTKEMIANWDEVGRENQLPSVLETRELISSLWSLRS
jgi:hypothetical protein